MQFPPYVATVFPTGVGVNQAILAESLDRIRFPHRRGGEPGVSCLPGNDRRVFPTGVGVNRKIAPPQYITRVFPTGVGVNRSPGGDSN